MQRLFSEFAARCPGGALPDTYLVFDTETSGTDPAKDAILQFGFCVVQGRKAVDRFAFLCKRPGVHIHPEAQKVHGITPERLDREGLDAAELVPHIVETLETYRRNGCMFVGHNMMSFDAPFLERECRFHGREFKFNDNEIFDTGALVKAARLGMYFDPNDTLRSFAYRVAGVRRKGCHWSLDRYCYDAYGLGERSGIKKSDAHDAGVDCFLTHHLLEALREKAEAGHVLH